MSVLHVQIHRLDRQGSRREWLLALSGVRRDLEPRSTQREWVATVATVSDDTMDPEKSRSQTVRELEELIAALDRRVPHVERMGELSIARAAAALRADALRRIEELQRDAPAGARHARA